MALIRDSSAVEWLPVKKRDVSSNPTLGATHCELFPDRLTVRTAGSEPADGGLNPSLGASVAYLLGSAKWQARGL